MNLSRAFRREGTALLPGLDGLRAISVLFVILGHLYWAPSFPLRSLAGLVNPANLGVRMFFVISGYLITTILLGEAERTGAISLSRFYYRRTLRIFPAYYVFLLVVFALQWASIITVGPWDKVYALTYTFNFKGEQATWWLGHTWSLGVEEQFYLLWPLAVKRAPRRWLSTTVVAALVVPPLLRVLLLAFSPDICARVMFMLPVLCDPLALGAGLALLMRTEANRSAMRRLVDRPVWWVVPPAVMLIEALNNRPHFFPHPLLLAGGLQPLANLGLALVLLRAVLVSDDAVSRFLNWRVMTTIGVMSYSLYLWQMLFISPSTHPGLTFPLSLIWTALAATASYLLVERPFNAIRNAHSRRVVLSSSGGRSEVV